jgi:hypothetical protein
MWCGSLVPQHVLLIHDIQGGDEKGSLVMSEIAHLKP